MSNIYSLAKLIPSKDNYTLLTLKYEANLLNAPVSSVLHKNVCDFDCDWQHLNVFSHCLTLTRVLQMISYPDTKVPVLVVMEYKRASVLYVYKLIFLLHTSRSTEYNP